MNRMITLALIGGVIAVLSVAMATAAFLVGRNYFAIATRETIYWTLTPTAVEISASTETPTATATQIPATAVIDMPTTTAATLVVPTATPPATGVPPTPIITYNTPVQFVLVKTDLNMRSGPGTTYTIMGWVAGGQTARVTGISGDGRWWRVVCPDNTVGSCWISANESYTQPSSGVDNPPTVTPAPAACTDRAVLVADVTIPDGSILAPDVGFNKTWRLQNSGNCTWDGNYRIVHAGGHLLGAISTSFPLSSVTRPGATVDVTISMVSPDKADRYQSDWKLQNPQGQLFGVGRSGSPFWVDIVVSDSRRTTISGIVYEDSNQNGIYDVQEPVLAGREIWLIPGTACHVQSGAAATARSGNDGRYTLMGDFSGSYCVGLPGSAGLDDVVAVQIDSGQALYDINLHTVRSSGSISGWLWNDYCLTTENGDALAGDCVADVNGDYHADGMIQPTEGYISGVTILLQSGSCATDNPLVQQVSTDASGRYTFNNLPPGTYCVLMNAAAPENGPRLLPGDWTFPSRGIWYQEITIRAGDSAYPVNFGWDYQLN